MGLNLSDVYSALSAFMGGNYVNDFVEFNRVYQVNIAAQGNARSVAGDVLRLNVRGSRRPDGAFRIVRSGGTGDGLVIDKSL